MQDWLEEYVELMFGPKHTLQTMDNAAIIKYEHMPERFYKYRKFSDKHMEALQKGILYSSPPSEFNDIIDTNLVITDEARAKIRQRTYDSIRDLYGLPEKTITSSEEFIYVTEKYSRVKSDKQKRLPEQLVSMFKCFMEEQLEKILEEYRNINRDRYNVCCFSASNDNHLMWAHYSSEHTGFCIEYDFKSQGITANNVQLMLPVIYLEDGRLFIKDIDEVDSSFLMYCATVKSAEWKYEQEWRLFYLGEDSAPRQMPKPTAIYLGVKTKKENEVKMLQFCNEVQIPLYRMYYDSRISKLRSKPV